MALDAGWIFFGVHGTLLLGSLGVALSNGRRLGPTTAYGQLFTLTALGLWFIFTGVCVFRVTDLVLRLNPQTNFVGDAVYLLGYACVALVLVTLYLRFRSLGEPERARFAPPVAFAAAATVAAAVILALRGGPSGWTAHDTVRLLYVMVSTVGMVAAFLSARILTKLRSTALAQFGAFLAAAVIVDAACDYWYAAEYYGWIPPSKIGRDLGYAAAGVLLVVALVRHEAALRRFERSLGRARDPGERFYDEVGRSWQELAVRECERDLRPILGPAATHIVEIAIEQVASAARGRAPDVPGRAALSPEAWAEVLRIVRDRAEAIAGAAGALAAERALLRRAPPREGREAPS